MARIGVSGPIRGGRTTGWASGRRDSAHGTWVSRRALSLRRACCCRRSAAGNLVHVRAMASGGGAIGERVGQRRRARGVRGPGVFSADVGVWPHVCMRRRARIRVQARASKPARAWVSACAATTRRNDSTARNVHAHATLGTPGGCAVRRHAALPWDTPGCGDMLRHLGILPGALARNKNHGGNKQGTCLLRGRLSGFLLNNPHEMHLDDIGTSSALQHYCLGWVLFPHLSIETATLERLASKNPPVCPSIKFPSRWRGHGPFDNSTKRIQAPGRRSPEPRALARLPPNLPPGTGLRTPSFSF